MIEKIKNWRIKRLKEKLRYYEEQATCDLFGWDEDYIWWQIDKINAKLEKIYEKQVK